MSQLKINESMPSRLSFWINFMEHGDVPFTIYKNRRLCRRHHLCYQWKQTITIRKYLLKMYTKKQTNNIRNQNQIRTFARNPVIPFEQRSIQKVAYTKCKCIITFAEYISYISDKCKKISFKSSGAGEGSKNSTTLKEFFCTLFFLYNRLGYKFGNR